MGGESERRGGWRAESTARRVQFGVSPAPRGEGGARVRPARATRRRPDLTTETYKQHHEQRHAQRKEDEDEDETANAVGGASSAS